MFQHSFPLSKFLAQTAQGNEVHIFALTYPKFQNLFFMKTLIMCHLNMTQGSLFINLKKLNICKIILEFILQKK